MHSDNNIRLLIKDAVMQVDPAAEVYLFGSRARGDANKFSDWDVLILSSRLVDENLKDLVRNKFLEIEISTDQIITSLIYSKSTWHNHSVTPLFQNIHREGLRL